MNTFQKFIRYYGPYKAVFFFDLLCAAFISIVDLAFPQILRTLTSTLFLEDSNTILRTLPWIAAVLLIFYIVQALCKYYVSCQGHIMGAKMERDMRRELFEHYEKLSFSYYDKNNTGQMMSRLVSDLFDISEFAHHGPENLFISVVKIVGSFIFLFLIQWKLALILAAVVIFMILFSAKQNQRMQATFLDNRRKIGDINATLQDSLAGIRIVQSFANEGIEREKFHRGNEGFLVSKKDNYRAMGTFQGGNTFFQGLMYLITLTIGGCFVALGEMTPTDLAMYALYIGIFISPIQILVELTEMMQKGLSGFRRFLDIIETEPEIFDTETAVPIQNPQGDISYNDVSFSYEDNEIVLNHISFRIPAGKSVALVGPSGGGKTTICSLLPRFYDITGGSIAIGGQDIQDMTLESLRNSIGIVQQDVYLFGGSIKENIAYGKPDASMDEIIQAAKNANIHDFIMDLPDGYDTFVGERGTRLSGGQKQRISIARVFLKNPPILILDEATSALDNESERHIQKSLEALSKNRTTITIAHRLSTIKHADEILVVNDHTIKERGSHQELIQKDGIYARYYRMQFEGLETLDF
ncbi:MAG TPA: ABC transporter ATP-binding protein/permease [Candidatus Anaerostipes excrementavium]|uniref:ABC transporter ATP-binding protein/permease n=1 Tax=Candidatus Anaerostipes excrementavium TaxID=2838463 RepID=A0A9D2BAE8_9FIRM|nr:ABC transporter ATP-binding protein [uncultured Anaerostipes sp.]HIX68936.1 ABC transporter ATP-binding protein/permease [Candidatus Anaerostipes excrementavium]